MKRVQEPSKTLSKSQFDKNLDIQRKNPLCTLSRKKCISAHPSIQNNMWELLHEYPAVNVHIDAQKQTMYLDIESLQETIV